VLARANDIFVDQIITTYQVNQMFNLTNKIEITDLIDVIDKEIKVNSCVEEYIKKQSKSYAKIAQQNLYDLMHNFDNIVSRIYGKKGIPDDISYQEKIEVLAKLQCDAYYKMGILK
jgi:hypothetical protein